MIRLSYRGHDIVIFVSAHLTEVTIESLDLEITIEHADVEAGFRAAKAALDKYDAQAPNRYLRRVA